MCVNRYGAHPFLPMEALSEEDFRVNGSALFPVLRGLLCHTQPCAR